MKALIAALLVISGIAAQAAGPKPLWTGNIETSKYAATFGVIPGSDHASGIAPWDKTHILVYSLRSTGQLAVRKANDTSEGAWVFLVEVRNLATGAVEQTAEIPAGSKRSLLAVIATGLVESDPNALVFYSRTFYKLDRDFRYTPLVPDSATSRRVPGLVQVAADQKHFMLVDPGGSRSRIYLFNAADTLQQLFTGVVSDMDPTSITIGDAGYFYSGFGDPGQIYFGTFDAAPEHWRSKGRGRSCHIPIYVTPDSFLDVCKQVSLITSRRRGKVLYRGQKSGDVSAPALLSPDKQRIAAHGYQFGPGSAYSWSSHLNHLSVWLVPLNGNPKHAHGCEIPIAAIPRYQFSFSFADDSHLVVLNDSTVSAYAVPCAN